MPHKKLLLGLTDFLFPRVTSREHDTHGSAVARMLPEELTLRHHFPYNTNIPIRVHVSFIFPSREEEARIQEVRGTIDPNRETLHCNAIPASVVYCWIFIHVLIIWSFWSSYT